MTNGIFGLGISDLNTSARFQPENISWDEVSLKAQSVLKVLFAHFSAKELKFLNIADSDAVHIEPTNQPLIRTILKSNNPIVLDYNLEENGSRIGSAKVTFYLDEDRFNITIQNNTSKQNIIVGKNPLEAQNNFKPTGYIEIGGTQYFIYFTDLSKR